VDKEMIPVHGRCGTLFNASMSLVPGVWIDQESDLMLLVDRIVADEIREIAVDLEAHSYRSFSGFVCLMQISLRRPERTTSSPLLNPENENSVSTAYDFLIDTLRLRRIINRHLAPIFADPTILKVMHGANSDILWLQRDFGIYVVNLFDTGIATRFLPHLGSYGLAKILCTFADVQADKKHQLSDWRQRPLPNEMRKYAVSDTMYLLDLYDRLKLELTVHNESSDIVQVVFEESKQICLLRYDNEPFYPSGYKVLMNRRMKSINCSITEAVRENVLKRLFDWRDFTARELDESLQYVCPDTILVRLSDGCPITMTELQAIVGPQYPIILSNANHIIATVKSVIDPETALGDNLSKTAIIEPLPPKCYAAACQSNSNDNSEGQQYSDIDEDDSVLGTGKVEVHSSNADFVASLSSPHSVEMMKLSHSCYFNETTKQSSSTHGQTVSGFGAINATLHVSYSKIEKECDEAHKSAIKIHQKMTEHYSDSSKFNLQPESLNHDISLSNLPQSDADDSDVSDVINIEEKSQRDNSLPRSLREIYR
jgi:exosome complex exonuclease RRP6